MSVRDDLTEINGVGEATADKILEIVGDDTQAKEHLETAIEYYEAGQDGYAKGYVYKAFEEL